MKKFFATLMACVALCNAAFAITPEEAYILVHSGLNEVKQERQVDYIRNLPYDTFKQYATAVVNKMEAVTNNIAQQLNTYIFDLRMGAERLDTMRSFLWACGEKLNEKDMDAIDTRISNMFKGKRLIYRGEVFRFCDEYPYFPKTSEVLFEEYDIPELDRNVSRYRPRHNESISREYMAARVNRIIGTHSENFGELKYWLRDFLFKAARMRLQERSEGFVVRRDGSNPLKEIFDHAAACVNAPHQTGLKELIEDYCPGYKWIEVKYPSDIDVMVMVGDILNGKESIEGKRGTLFYSLGAQQYNQFIDRYNGRK